MLIKNLFFAFILIMSLISSNVFAGKEDWQGTFTVVATNGEKVAVTHAPNGVGFSFLHAGQTIHLQQGSTINGFKVKEGVALLTNSNVEEFSTEVTKLGTIVDKTITLGPTYLK